MSDFEIMKKAPSHWKKLFLKKIFQLIAVKLTVKIRSSKRCVEVF